MTRVFKNARWSALGALLMTFGVLLANQDVVAQSKKGALPGTNGATTVSQTKKMATWTCAMHPQVRHGSAGACPICGHKLTKQLVAEMSLEGMIAVALKHSPDIRLANAKLRAAEAELDRTRLDVVQKLIAYREKWQAQQFAVNAAERELAEVEKQQGESPSKASLLDSAKNSVSIQRARLAEIETQIPFLLGRPVKKAAPRAEPRRKMLKDELLPKARQILQVRVREYQKGDSGILEVAAAHRQLAELEGRLADNRDEKIAAIELQKQLMQRTRDIAEQLYKAGEAAQGDVLTIDLEVSKLDLLLLELKH